MPKGENPENFDVLTASDVADLLFVTERTVRNWMNKGGLPSIDGGRGKVMRWKDTLEWYVRYRCQEDGNGGNHPVRPGGNAADDIQSQSPESMENALRRKTIADADRAELKLAIERAEVVAIADVEKSIEKVSTSLKTAILAMPAKMSTRLYGVKEKTQLRAILDREARDLCTKLATIGAESAPEVPMARDEDL